MAALTLACAATLDRKWVSMSGKWPHQGHRRQLTPSPYPVFMACSGPPQCLLFVIFTVHMTILPPAALHCTRLPWPGLACPTLACPVLAAVASQGLAAGSAAAGKCNSFEWGNFFHYEWCGDCAFYPFIIYEFRVQTYFASKQVVARERIRSSRSTALQVPAERETTRENWRNRESKRKRESWRLCS